MNLLVLLLVLALNAAISAWNAYASGAYLTESKAIGGMTRFLTWCGLVMAACGFTWCYVAVFALAGQAFHLLTDRQATVVFELGYLIIILPILGSGLAIWADSVARAWRERSFGSTAVAGWNTYAQASNMWHAAKDAPGVFSSVKDFFASDDEDNGGRALVLLLVILALAAGILTTAGIARWADRQVALDVVRA
jgi:hypothetical protein